MSKLHTYELGYRAPITMLISNFSLFSLIE